MTTISHRLTLRVTLPVMGLAFATGLLALLGAERLAQPGVADPAAAAQHLASVLALVRIASLGLPLALGLLLALILDGALVRPIADLSRRLRQWQGAAGPSLAPPAGHEQDELGRLAADLNALVGRLERALAQERERTARLAQDQRRSQAILDHVGTGIFVVRGDGTLETWTPAFLRLLGQEASAPDPEVPFQLLFGPESVQAEVCLRACQVAPGRQVATLRLRVEFR